jgi:lysozyme family protein
MLSFQALKDDYETNWANLKIRPARAEEVRKEATRLLKGKSTYHQVEAKTGIPWWFIGLCHYRESHFNFDTYLGNGQPLSRVTTIVPKGRGPFAGANAFVDGAVDALRLEDLIGSSDWSIARTLFRLEGFNGFGYHNKGVNSPYLYGGSNIYGPPEARGGKFVRDHVFDPDTVDPQLGVAVLLKGLLELDSSIDLDEVPTRTITQPDDELARTVLQVQESLNKLGVYPRLAEDGKNGPRTKAAISKFQQDNRLADTGLPDAATVAALALKTSSPPAQVQMPADSLLPILQRLGDLEKAVRSSTNGVSTSPNDPIGLLNRLLSLVHKADPTPGTTPIASVPNDPIALLEQLLNLVQKPDPKFGTTPIASVPNDPTALLERLLTLVQKVDPKLATTPTAALPNDAVSLVDRLLGLMQKADPKLGTVLPAGSAPDAAQLQKVIGLLTAILGTTADGKPPLGQVNGALGETIGNLLNGKKTAIGIGGSLITALLAAVTSAPGAGGVAGLLGTIATAVPGLSQFALPIFLATTVWGVLGKFEKWTQGTAPPPKPQS